MPEIFSLPNPLHPAVVHFPIVLLLLGAFVALVMAFVPRGRWPGLSAACFLLGAAGAVVAVQTGEEDGESAHKLWGGKSVLKHHEDWAEATQVAAIAAAVLSLGVLFTQRWPFAARSLAIATAVAGLVSAWCVIETGHYGGQLVYRYGFGQKSILDSFKH